jgi:UDP-N-acetyl-D-mannosaminuronic acid dehydrogenase
MPLTLLNGRPGPWQIRKIGVMGPGIVGMPMAALLAHAQIREGTDQPATVTVIQRRSATSGWKVDAINAGRSPIGGVEPDLDRIVAEASAQGLLRASHDAGDLRDADVVLVCVQTDKAGIAPDYGPMFEALTSLAEALRHKPSGNIPLIVFESTLAPSSMATVVREHFARYGLEEGRDVLLGNSPNRVMPGRLVERVATSDKIVAGLHPATPGLIARLYGRIVTGGRLLPTNSLTAEIVKTLENAYRDVRIAYAAELVRYCDDADVDFYRLRDAVNQQMAQVDQASHDPAAIPTGGLLVPTIGVGGHCLPKDGVLLWWRALERGEASSASLILESRRINDQSPTHCLRMAERAFGQLSGRRVTVLGAAYRPDSEDTRNSPSLVLTRLLLDRGCQVTLHDPYVRPDDQNLSRLKLESCFTRDLEHAAAAAEVVIVGTGHREYTIRRQQIANGQRIALFDACNLYRADDFAAAAVSYAGLGRGRRSPEAGLISAACAGFQSVERGVANELERLISFLNQHYALDDFNRVDFAEVQRLAATCTTGCAIVAPGKVAVVPAHNGFDSRLARLAHDVNGVWD